jgi:hypothetical protein
MVNGLLWGSICPACKFLVRGDAYEQAIAHRWDKMICKCKPGDTNQLQLFNPEFLTS